MYYFLGCFGPLDKDRASITNIPQFDDIYWNMGDLITQPVPEPIEIDLYTDEGDEMVPMFNVGILVMEDRMVQSLENAGVNNLQTFQAILHDRKKNITYDNYLVVNIVGRIACADLDQSKYTAYGEPIIDVDFDSVTLDESKILGARMFRFAECVSGILIHEEVKEALEADGIQYLDFTPPEQWVG